MFMSARKAVCTAVVLFVFFSYCIAQSEADVPRYVSFQGRVTGVSDGDVDMLVTFWTAETSGTQLFYDFHADVPVINGVFSLMIGEGVDEYSSANGGVPDSAIDSAAVWVQLYADDGSDPVTLPRTQLVSTPYSIMADKADGAYAVLMPGTDDVMVCAKMIGDPAVKPAVGIGTDSPISSCYVDLGSNGHNTEYFGLERIGKRMFLTPNWGNDPCDPKAYIGTSSSQGTDLVLGVSAVERMRLTTDGYVGIGTQPGCKFHVNLDCAESSDELFKLTRDEKSMFFSPAWGAHLNPPEQLAYMGTATSQGMDLVLGVGAVERMRVTTEGYVGIGNDDPTCLLDVAGDVSADGYVGIGTAPTASYRLDVAGTTRTEVLQITGGADLAEKFPVSEAVQPGMVVAIDPDNAGQLCLARGAYNRCVAGVVSGAGNLSAGAVLGNLPGAEDAPPIALTGRVWVWCDASQGPIVPGDMLTTSETPGYAMQAADRDKSHGAVIGKAMTGLVKDRGLVLVLVNLQ